MIRLHRRAPRLTLVACLAVSLLAARPAARGTKGPSPKGNCAVCGMFVANFPDWACRIGFKDGTEAWFDGPKDLFTFLLNPAEYAPKRTAADVASVQVRDYYSLKAIDAAKACFVLGSDVLGPMGKELVPFADRSAAVDFQRDHKGLRILSFQEIQPATLKALE